MKKLALMLLISGLTIANLAIARHCNTCGCTEEVEARPVCEKLVKKKYAAKKVCEKSCHFECPNGTAEGGKKAAY